MPLARTKHKVAGISKRGNKETIMGTTRAFLAGAIAGAGAAYFFDARMGRRRRATVEDGLRKVSHRAADAIDAGIRDMGNRAQGVLHDVGSLVDPRQTTRSLSSMSRGRFKWSPGPRLLAATCGTALMANCAISRTPGAILLGALGAGLFSRSLSGRANGVHISKTLEIAAPVDQVFEFFAHPENYLRISDVVTNVEVFGDGRFAKDMSIAGIPVHFEERFVCCRKNDELATRSEPSSAISYTKQMRFEPIGDFRTRLHLHFCYHPPGGVLGHAFATMLGIDPKSELSDLLMRAKYFLETGREPHDAVARRKRVPDPHNGSKKQPVSENTLQGPGAPPNDIQDFRWPPARSTTPATAETLGPFPID
jgi:uncharacterized membrane protein